MEYNSGNAVLDGTHFDARITVPPAGKTDTVFDGWHSDRVTGKPEVIDSSVGLVLRNALGTTEGIAEHKPTSRY